MLKRIVDVLLSALALAIVWPLFIVAAILIRMDSAGPTFYRGTRIGRNGKPFRQWKLRTMVKGTDAAGCSRIAGNDARITHVGRVLRKFKIDELPQFINVLLGDMSLVGPRPDVQEYVDLYTGEEKALLSLRPGITDWATLWDSDEDASLVGFRNIEEDYRNQIHPTKVKLQLKYLRDHSLSVDAKIVYLTAICVLAKLFTRRHGLSPPRGRKNAHSFDRSQDAM